MESNMMSAPYMNAMGNMPYCPMMYNMGMNPYMQSQPAPCMMYNASPMMFPNNPGVSATMPGMMYPYEMKRISEDDGFEFEEDAEEYREPENIEAILKKIETNNPMIFKKMAAYGVPPYEVRKFVRKIISLSLIYGK